MYGGMSDTRFTNKDVYELFDAIADLMEILGEDRFRINAYRKAAAALQAVTVPLGDLYDRHQLLRIDGLTKGMAEKVAELYATGAVEYYSRLKERMPVGVRELLRVPHIGPRTAGRLYNELGIAGLAQLSLAIESGDIKRIKGIGEKTLDGIREGIAAVADREERTLLLHAHEGAHRITSSLHEISGVLHVVAVGSVRRGMTTIGDLDVLIQTENPQTVLAALHDVSHWIRARADGHRLQALLHNGMAIDIQCVAPDAWGSAMVVATGSSAHVDWLATRAHERGLRLAFDGLWAGAQRHASHDEVSLYAALELPWIAPEVREWYSSADRWDDRHAVGFERSQMRSDLHMHTTWSDGNADIRTMAESARARGYTHAAITDHGALIGITNGLDAKRLRQQRAEIATVNASYAAAGIDFRLLHGVEVDILVDGSLALPDDILHELDIVVASPHINLRQSPEVATHRILRAIEHPAVDMIGHPRGRILGGRLGAPVDMQQVITVAAAHQVALEVNSGPDRLDIDGELVRDVVRAGGLIAVNSDAHDPANHAWIEQGVVTARRGGVPAERVINTWSLASLQAFVGRPRTAGENAPAGAGQ
jgi:DNA polymerase (family 10)